MEAQERIEKLKVAYDRYCSGYTSGQTGCLGRCDANSPFFMAGFIDAENGASRLTVKGFVEDFARTFGELRNTKELKNLVKEAKP